MGLRVASEFFNREVGLKHLTERVVISAIRTFVIFHSRNYCRTIMFLNVDSFVTRDLRKVTETELNEIMQVPVPMTLETH